MTPENTSTSTLPLIFAGDAATPIRHLNIAGGITVVNPQYWFAHNAATVRYYDNFGHTLVKSGSTYYYNNGTSNVTVAASEVNTADSSYAGNYTNLLDANVAGLVLTSVGSSTVAPGSIEGIFYGATALTGITPPPRALPSRKMSGRTSTWSPSGATSSRPRPSVPVPTPARTLMPEPWT